MTVTDTTFRLGRIAVATIRVQENRRIGWRRTWLHVYGERPEEPVQYANTECAKFALAQLVGSKAFLLLTTSTSAISDIEAPEEQEPTTAMQREGCLDASA